MPTPAVSRRDGRWLAALIAVAVLLRLLLAASAPTPYGYVYDFYHEAIQRFYATGRLPPSTACWQCYHPPLLTLVGLPFYTLGRAVTQGPVGLADPALRFVTPLALLFGAALAYGSFRILRHYRIAGTELLLGTGLVLGFPCLFISSYGIEADILLSALMVGFFAALLPFLQVRRTGRGTTIAVGVLAGLACATKYSGLLAPIVLVVSVAGAMPATRHRARLARRTAVALAICAALGSWKYADNLRVYGRPLFANGSAQQGFSLSERVSQAGSYEFLTLHLDGLRALTAGEVPPGALNDLPIYRSVPTTLHAMAWGDMSFFSDHSRHGFFRHPYPDKAIDPTLAFSVLLLGLLPGGLAVVGFAATLRHRTVRPLAIASLLTLAAYAVWFTAQDSWALKTKYILFLLPPYVLDALFGLRAIRRWSPRVALGLNGCLAALIVLSHLYLFEFARR